MSEQRELLPAGDYVAKLIDYGIRESKTSKDASPTCIFAYKDDAGKVWTLYWQGSFNGGGAVHAMKALLVMGLSNADDLGKVADGPLGAALDMSRDYLLAVIQKPSYKDPSVLVNSVEWINAYGNAKFENAMSKSDFDKQIASKNLKGILMQIANEKGFTLGGKKAAAPAPSQTETAEIPF